MQYDLYDLGDLPKGTVLELTTSAVTDIKLIDKMNLDIRKYGGEYRCAYKHVTVSPYRLQVQEDRHWFLMVAQPTPGAVKHSLKIIKPKHQ